MSERYLKPHRFDALSPAAQRMARVPRYALLIARMPVESFEAFATGAPQAATYWFAYNYVARDSGDRGATGLLDDGFRASEAASFGWHLPEALNRREMKIRRWQVRLAQDLLGAVAFQMFLGLDGTGQQPPMFSVDRDVDGFLNKAFERFEKAGAYVNARGQKIPSELLDSTDWPRLKAMNSHGLRHLVFSDAEERVRFTDITTQTFFAAYWAVRWGDDTDRQILWNWLPDPQGDLQETYQEFWLFATDIPDAGIDRQRYELLFSRLYDGTWQDASGNPIRSTELIYRSWERMREAPAGKQFRSEFRELRDGSGEHSVVAQRLLEAVGTDRGPESQFLSLRQGQRGVKDTGRFQMGAPDGEEPTWDGTGENQENPPHAVRLTPYRLHRYCVSNAEYELFDRRHESHRAFSDKVRDLDTHPVVNVRWYDAWCFAKWVGVITIGERQYEVSLPTEAQWEYACRAGERTPFSWGGGRDGRRIESAYCNFDGNSPWQERGTPEARRGPYRERTVRVDGLDEDGAELFLPNSWGFFQMHGNVWEWCRDWYDREYYRSGVGQEVTDPQGPPMALGRVLRGGCWGLSGRSCRSGYRFWRAPVFRGRRSGFRLAAVPVSGAVAGGELVRSRGA